MISILDISADACMIPIFERYWLISRNDGFSTRVQALLREIVAKAIHLRPSLFVRGNFLHFSCRTFEFIRLFWQIYLRDPISKSLVLPFHASDTADALEHDNSFVFLMSSLIAQYFPSLEDFYEDLDHSADNISEQGMVPAFVVGLYRTTLELFFSSLERIIYEIVQDLESDLIASELSICLSN